ncbi:cytochrome P450 [Micromonospora echinofusca]|uniref:Cytochrome P450 n=1 Tax=Micromonospora echinofusca TaxID=47858 RepID=A0ABS3VNB3_MICEH|nr:cytochrome P450 [Micromonospora echinofusca]MBO4206027.1 cytochrome P450 [Micromonospora echinofusca]
MVATDGIDLAGIDLADPDLYERGDPDRVWAALRGAAPVFRNPGTAGREFWAVTRYRDAVAVYRDPDTFSSARGMVLGIDPEAGDPAANRMLVVTDPPRHPKLRRIISGVFTPRMMRRLDDRVRDTVVTLVDRAVAAGRCEFVDDVAARLPVAIICEILGVPPADQDWMYHLTSTAFGGGDPTTADEVSAGERTQAYGEIFEYYQDLATQRRRAPTDDLVSTLVHGEVDGHPLDTEDVLLNCTNLIIGGNETTRHAAAGGLLALAERPVSWQVVRADPAVVPTLVEEILRWTTPGMHAMRTVVTDTTLGGQQIRAGESVVVWNASANRDEEVFAAPQRFDVRRSPNRHIAFGQGGHHCLGASLARIELTVLFEELAKRVSTVQLSGPVQRVRSCVLRGIRRLPVELS